MAGTGGTPYNTKLEANDIELELSRVHKEITTLKSQYYEEKSRVTEVTKTSRTTRRALKTKINALVNINHALLAKLEGTDPDRMADMSAAPASSLAGIIFGGDATADM